MCKEFLLNKSMNIILINRCVLFHLGVSHSLSLFRFRLGRWASRTLAFWVRELWELWEEEQQVELEVSAFGEHSVAQLSAADVFSTTGL